MLAYLAICCFAGKLWGYSNNEATYTVPFASFVVPMCVHNGSITSVNLITTYASNLAKLVPGFSEDTDNAFYYLSIGV